MAVVALFVVATVVGLVALWPPAHVTASTPDLGAKVRLVDGTVTRATPVPCAQSALGANLTCRTVEVRLSDGPEKGDTTTLDITESVDQPVLRTGDRIVLGRTFDLANGATYYFSDYQRRIPLLVLGGLFAAMVVGLARWRGGAAIVGLGVSLLVLVRFVLPGVLAGESPLLMSIVGSSVIVLFVVYLAHGVSTRTTTALVGTLVSLSLTGVLGVVFVHAARMTGLASEEATYLRGVLGSRVNIQGLLLGGIVIGSLGVLNDVTVTQASAVWEIFTANPATSVGRLYRSAMRIGADHIASTVYTLVLAYAGAALPLLVVFTVADRSLGDVVTGELVAEEVVRTLVGSVGLVAAVPITTGLACLLVTRMVASGPAGGDG